MTIHVDTDDDNDDDDDDNDDDNDDDDDDVDVDDNDDDHDNDDDENDDNADDDGDDDDDDDENDDDDDDDDDADDNNDDGCVGCGITDVNEFFICLDMLGNRNYCFNQAACFVSTDLPADGYFVVCFWSAKTMMWGVFTIGSARSFTKKYFESSPGLVQNNSA